MKCRKNKVAYDANDLSVKKSGFGVMPQMSGTGKTMVSRTLDWPDASIEKKWFVKVVGKH